MENKILLELVRNQTKILEDIRDISNILCKMSDVLVSISERTPYKWDA